MRVPFGIIQKEGTNIIKIIKVKCNSITQNKNIIMNVRYIIIRYVIKVKIMLIKQNIRGLIWM